jgi:carbonic anhydrase
MRKLRFTGLVLIVLIALVILPALAAETPKTSGFLDYSATPLGIDTAVPAAPLAWLNQVFGLMGSSDFTFIYRIDPDHWMGLYRERLAMVLHVHDGSAAFDFRALVDRSSGRLTVIKGVAYAGQSRSQAAKTSAATAIGYLERVLGNKDIFRGGAAKAAGAPAAHNEPATKAPVVSSVRSPMGYEDPLSRLMEGNRRFVDGTALHPNGSPARRAEVAKGQKPFAIVLTCSDSRLPPEILFDVGLGDLFVVRTAGEVIGDLEVGSIEYAAEHLHATHLMVLGHERCGAVDATIKGGEVSDNIARIALQIQPAVAMSKGKPGDLLENSIKQNALNMRDKALKSPVLGDLLHEKKLSVSVAYYDLDTGLVSMVPETGASASHAPAATNSHAPAAADSHAAPAADSHAAPAAGGH